MHQHTVTTRLSKMIESEVKAPCLLDAGDVVAPDGA